MQEKLLEKSRQRREKENNGVGINHVHNGDLGKLKNLYIRSQKNKVRRSNYGGYVTLPYKNIVEIKGPAFKMLLRIYQSCLDLK